MSSPFRLSSCLWFFAPILALGFIVWTDLVRVRRVEYVTGLAGATAAIDARSATGYAGGVRLLIVPGHNNDSYQWIAQTQQMLAEGNWRLRHVDYDNAPGGRAVRSPSPYRWWLGLVAWGDHTLSGRPLGLAVEKAALWADPLLHVLLLASVLVFAAIRFGAWAATLLSIGVAAFFPFAGGFLPGAPGDSGLTQILALWSVLPLLAGIIPSGAAAPRVQRWFFFAGIVGGCGLWVNAGAQVPLLLGLGLGGIASAVLARRPSMGTAPVTLPWRSWALGGSIATFLAFLLEYAPAHLELGSLRLDVIHPLYAVAWLGGGELLARVADWLQGCKPVAGRRAIVVTGLAILALVAIPTIMLFKRTPAFLTLDPYAFRLSGLAGGVEAESLVAWMVRDGFSQTLWATCLPVLLLGPAGWLLWRSDTGAHRRTAIALVLGPVLVALGFTCARLNWWNLLDTLLLALLLVMANNLQKAAKPALTGLAWAGGVLLVSIPGLLLLLPARETGLEPVVTRQELVGLVERDLAHWFARKAGPEGAIILAPPNLTTSLYFHGGLRGLGSPYRENEEGFRVSVRIAGATSADEAQALVRQRKVTHIVIPSWDGFLDDYARLGAGQPGNSLMDMLHSWLPPRWLRPVSFQLPKISGFEDERVVIFEVTDVQDNGTALSRLAEYFLEMNQVKLAVILGRTLAESFPVDMGALVARAQTDFARRDQRAFTKVLESIVANLNNPMDDSLLWDRRVSLSVVLAEGQQIQLARTQAKKCLEEMSESDLRGLSTIPLYRFLTLCKALGLELRNPELKTLAKNLLPPEMRLDI